MSYVGVLRQLFEMSFNLQIQNSYSGKDVNFDGKSPQSVPDLFGQKINTGIG